MGTAAQLRPGALVHLDNRFYKIIESVLHSGAGKAGSMVHAKLRCLETGAVTERRFNPTDNFPTSKPSARACNISTRTAGDTPS